MTSAGLVIFDATTNIAKTRQVGGFFFGGCPEIPTLLQFTQARDTASLVKTLQHKGFLLNRLTSKAQDAILEAS
jgi:hypothetical protein